ncbi:SHOCT domain-containing protein [Sphingobium sp. HBC34]|uniref:SHOCT domain-containing protein n=1 Tax=Sphingobium cyanobacteriorum TaxID=3063954 RepID=A0ABT8ZGL6_9SPHN|nr:SHOCT domain-containing protein [Sphingobium sp. HBC34]MDO7833684.1 SHOCT domain-containing protein [Sphingobium sp. HBC34]
MIDAAEPLNCTGITIWTEGEILIVKYSVWYYGFLGTKRVPVSKITSVNWKEPGEWLAGFLEISILGEQPPSPHASPNVQHQNRFQFGSADRAEFAALRDWIEERRAAGESTESRPSSVADEIAKLGKLVEQGLLTPDEFQAHKSKLLN